MQRLQENSMPGTRYFKEPLHKCSQAFDDISNVIAIKGGTY